jgi:hypothetical protein
MPRVQDFDPAGFPDGHDSKRERGYEEAANTNVAANGSAHERKFVQQIDVIKRRVCEVLSSVWVPLQDHIITASRSAREGSL